MSNELMRVAWRQNLPHTEKMVLVALADCANEQGVTWIAIRSRREDKLDLLTMTSLSERAVQNAIKALVAEGHLTRVETLGRGVTYTVHPRTGCTPAQDAPPQGLRPAGGAPTPAPRAPKPSVTPINPDADASGENAGGQAPEPSKRRWPKEMPPPEGVSDDQWAGFITHRKAKRNQLTSRAYDLLIGKLARQACGEWPPGLIIDTIVERGWLSFEMVWLNKISDNGNGKRPHSNRPGGRFRDPLLNRYAGGGDP